jgi:hypothetical protein
VSDAEAPTPALYDHALRVYEEMKNRSTVQRVDPAAQDDEFANVYEGHLTQLFSDLSIANPYYSKIRDALVAQGCMEQLRRGGGSALSKWVLVKPPEEETFRSFMEMKRRPLGRAHILEQQVKGLTGMVNEALGTIEGQELRIQVLERKILSAGLK